MILNIDTTEICERVSLFRVTSRSPIKSGMTKQRLTSEIYWEGKRNETEKLLPAILRVLKKAKLNFEDLDSVAVNPGPGGFSALRIGVTVANTLALALGVPLYEMDGKKLRKVKIVMPRYNIPPKITLPKAAIHL